MIIKIEITDQDSNQSLEYQSPFSYANIVDDMRQLYIPCYGFYIVRFEIDKLMGEVNACQEMINDDYGKEFLRYSIRDFVHDYIESFLEIKDAK